MADGDAFVGGEASLYYNSGNYASPTWVEVENCGDLDSPDTRSTVAAPTRGKWPFVGYLLGNRDIGLSWSSLQKKGTADAALTALVTAYDAGTAVEFAIADGAIATAGTKYRRMQMKISKADQSEPIDGVVTISFEAKPDANSAVNPARATVA